MSEKKYNFKKFTPKKDVELKIYDDALNFVFENDDIKNVAISGAYSAGKSSVIESYKNKHPSIRFLHISLAYFESNESEEDEMYSTEKVVEESIEFKKKENKKTNDLNESEIEGKILNQLIHRIDPSKIPQTNFKVKQKISNKSIILTSALITIFLICMSHIILFSNWKQLVTSFSTEWIKNLFLWTTNSQSLLFSGVICITIFVREIYSIIRIQKNKGIFKSFKFQGNEIEIFEQSEESYFDKYLNEVLYLFEKSNADVIVFEDIDRYNMNHIFVRLREINILVNNQFAEEKKDPIRFFYLLKDDIFISKDRTKFFDFIIPIVPVIDGSNSYDQFIEHFKEGGIFGLFDEIFLQNISLYVDDLRILKNIYNEFIIYRNRIGDIEINCNKLLALILYKNLFPRDFSDLQLGKGFIHTLFANKSKFIDEKIKAHEKRIDLLNNRIHQTEEECLLSHDELDAIYLIFDENYPLVSVNGKFESAFNTRSAFIRAMKDNLNSVTRRQTRYNNEHKLNIEDMLKELKNDEDYIQRYNRIDRKSSHKIQEIKTEIENLQKEMLEIQNEKLRNIINKNNIDSIFGITFTNEIGKENKFHEIKSNPYFALIKYLINNGYIDETYSDYMTYFYENSLSRIDKIFLRSVTDEQPKEYNYQLKDAQKVVSRLRIVDFDREEILNFDLLGYLLRTQIENRAHLTHFLHQLKDTKNYKFIGLFFNTNNEVSLFIKAINSYWSNIFHCIRTESDFTDNQKNCMPSFHFIIHPMMIFNCLTKKITACRISYLKILIF